MAGIGGRVAAAGVVVAAFVGAGAFGYYARQPEEPPAPIERGSASPLAAADPAIPSHTPPVPDYDYPPLATDLGYTTITKGRAPFRYRWLVPEGWVETPLGPSEWRWVLPDNLEDSYNVRVEIVLSQRDTFETIMERRLELLRSATGVAQMKVLEYDIKRAVLSYSYFNTRGRERINTLHWVDLTGGDSAQIEIATEGRTVDLPGLEALQQTIWSSVTQLDS